MITQNIYDNLTRIDEKLQPQPQLAIRWNANERGDVWTFTLRQGVKFHHGRELTARDVVYTFERILDPKTGSVGRTTMGPIDKVDSVDDYTVRFRLTAPFVDLPVSLGTTFGRITPADRGEKTDPSGTGPFRLAEFRPGDRTRLVRFKDYWDKGHPYLDEVWQVHMPQTAAQIAALTGEDVHILFEVPPPYIPSVKANAAVSIVEVPSPAFQTLTMMTTEKPFDDNRVRLAMKYLLDRDAIVRAVWQGHATAGEDHPVSRANPFYAATSPPHTYDVAKAKALLADAGYAGGLNLELWTTAERVGLQELAVAVQQMAAPAGIKIEVKSVPWSVFVGTVWKKKPFICDNYFGRATIDETLYPFFQSGGGWNVGGYRSAPVDRLLEEGRSESNAERRKGIYGRVQQALHDDGYMAVPYHPNYVTAMRSKVQGQAVHPLRFWDFRWTYLSA